MLPNFTIRLEPELRGLVKALVNQARQPGGRERLERVLSETPNQEAIPSTLTGRLAAIEERLFRLEGGAGAIGATHEPVQGDAVQTPCVDGGESFGAKLKAAREGRGLSQRALSAAAGIGQPTVSILEAGRREPTPEQRAALNKALALEAVKPNKTPLPT